MARIHRAAAAELLDECPQAGVCKTGDAKLTKDNRLPARYVIHAVGPVWHGGAQGRNRSCSHLLPAIDRNRGCERHCDACVPGHQHRRLRLSRGTRGEDRDSRGSFFAAGVSGGAGSNLLLLFGRRPAGQPGPAQGAAVTRTNEDLAFAPVHALGCRHGGRRAHVGEADRIFLSRIASHGESCTPSLRSTRTRHARAHAADAAIAAGHRVGPFHACRSR